MSPCHKRFLGVVVAAFSFHLWSGLGGVGIAGAITAGFGKGNGQTGGAAALGWGMGLAVPSMGTKTHKPALQWQQGGTAPVSIRSSVTPLSLKHPGCGAAAGCCPAVLLRLSSCQGAVCLALLSSASISFRGQRKGKKRSAWFVWAASSPPCCWGGEQKGAEHPETSSCPPGHAAPYISIPI